MGGAVTSMTRLEGKGSCDIVSFFSSGEAEAIGDKKHGSFSLGSNPKYLHQRLLSANLKWPLIYKSLICIHRISRYSSAQNPLMLSISSRGKPKCSLGPSRSGPLLALCPTSITLPEPMAPAHLTVLAHRAACMPQPQGLRTCSFLLKCPLPLCTPPLGSFEIKCHLLREDHPDHTG